jgi:hypothetical protein
LSKTSVASKPMNEIFKTKKNLPKRAFKNHTDVSLRSRKAGLKILNGIPFQLDNRLLTHFVKVEVTCSRSEM